MKGFGSAYWRVVGSLEELLERAKELKHADVLAWLLIALACTPPASALEFVRSMQVQSFESFSVARTLKYAVMLPSSYEKSTARFPVLYLLHGHTGDYRSWISYAQLPLSTPDQICAIVVLVDGGNSFYTNWYGARGSRPQNWEDMIVKDLIPHVDQRFRTQAARNGRFIGGLSMGGYGATTIALKHPSLFSFAFSSAGALQFAQHAEKEIRLGKPDWNQPELWSNEERPGVDVKEFSTQQERTPRGSVFLTAAQAGSADPFRLLAMTTPAEAPFLHLDAGSADSLAPETIAFVQQLREKGFAYSYVELTGAHEVPYWRNAFAHTVLALQRMHKCNVPRDGSK